MNKQTVVMIVDKNIYSTIVAATKEAIRATHAGINGPINILNAIVIPQRSTYKKWYIKIEYTTKGDNNEHRKRIS